MSLLATTHEAISDSRLWDTASPVPAAKDGIGAYNLVANHQLLHAKLHMGERKLDLAQSSIYRELIDKNLDPETIKRSDLLIHSIARSAFVLFDLDSLISSEDQIVATPLHRNSSIVLETDKNSAYYALRYPQKEQHVQLSIDQADRLHIESFSVEDSIRLEIVRSLGADAVRTYLPNDRDYVNRIHVPTDEGIVEIRQPS